jgi:hypothetical protein
MKKAINYIQKISVGVKFIWVASALIFHNYLYRDKTNFKDIL